MGQWFSRILQEGPSLTANLGLALDDMAVAPLLYKQAVEKGIGKWLEL
jgi:ornithine cyclodeaminase/alanine dehydrogenase